MLELPWQLDLSWGHTFIHDVCVFSKQLCTGSSMGLEPSEYEASADGLGQTSPGSQHVWAGPWQAGPYQGLPDIEHLQTSSKVGFNPIPTGLFESKFQLGGGGQFGPPPFRTQPTTAKFCMDVKTHVKSIAMQIFLPKMVYLLHYYNLCKLDAYYHIFYYYFQQIRYMKANFGQKVS